MFVVLLIHIELSLLLFTISCVIVIYDFFAQSFKFSNRLPIFADQIIAVVFLFISLFLSSVSGFLNGYLLGFHIFLRAKKITTYEYITSHQVNKVKPVEDQNFNGKIPHYVLVGIDSILSD